MTPQYRVSHDPVPPARLARLRIAAGVAGFCVAIVAAALAAPFLRSPVALRRLCARLIARLADAPLFVDLDIRNAERLTSHRPAVFVVNHQSIGEVPLLARCYPADSLILARTLVGRIPLVGWLYRRTGNLLVDRRGGPDVRTSLLRVAETLQRDGSALWVFAEGTRNPDARSIQPLKKGAFHVAAAMHGWIVPVVVSPVYPALSRMRRGRTCIRVLEPERAVSAAPQDVTALAERTRSRMQAAMDAMVAATES